MNSEAGPPVSEQTISLRSRGALVVIGVLLGGFFLYLTVRNVDVDEALATLYAIDLVWVLPLAGIFVLNSILRSIRWRLMFPDEKRPQLRHAFDALMIGKVGNNFMPGRLGDLLRVGIIGSLHKGVGVSGALATVVVEKVFDSLAILLFMGLALLVVPLPAWIVKGGLIALSAFMLLLAVLWVVNRVGMRSFNNGEVAATDTAWGRGRLLVANLVQKFSAGLYSLQHARHFTLLGSMTLLIWCVEVLMFYALFQAFSLSLSLLAALVTMVVLCVGLMLPAAPGFVGTYQLFIVAALAVFGVSENTAFAVAVFLNLFAIAATSLMGLYAVLVDGGLVNFRQIIGLLRTST